MRFVRAWSNLSFPNMLYLQSEGENEKGDEQKANKAAPAEDEDINQRLEKKKLLKERFDMEYDDADATYFDDLKEEMQKQAEVCAGLK